LVLGQSQPVNESNGSPKTKVAQNFTNYNVMQTKIKNLIKKLCRSPIVPKLDSFRANALMLTPKWCSSEHHLCRQSNQQKFILVQINIILVLIQRKILKIFPQNHISRGNFMRWIDCAHSRSMKMLLWPWFREIRVCIEAKIQNVLIYQG
jgi:hypothetical protein